MTYGAALFRFAPRPWSHRCRHWMTSLSRCSHRDLWASHSGITCSHCSLGIPDEDTPADTSAAACTVACGHCW
ncbi:hypothetical protein NDU88_006276 [Pleurodeles waltl]|uniref:Uncharacterized protein n=1 Tax=Pleurodeles waltl TaxID=8319 RepID=A0AAV7L527_PLEWA|nr:hypothetical protein NDU88_006276 [Pleurodeles waltl]